jgi:hypothetical protein
MSDVTTELKKLIVKPMSVAADAGISVAVGVAVYLLLGFVVWAVPFGAAGQAAFAGVAAAMVYMRARTNLLDPTPAFTVK